MLRLHELPTFKRTQSFLADKNAKFIKPPKRNEKFEVRFPIFGKPSPVGYQFNLPVEPPEVRIAENQLDTIKSPIRNYKDEIIGYEDKPFNFGKMQEILESSSAEQLKLIRELSEKKEAGQPIQNIEQQQIAVINIVNLNKLDELKDDDIKQAAKNTELLDISEKPEDEGFPRFITQKYFQDKVWSKGEIMQYLLAQAQKERFTGNVLRPIRGIKGDPILPSTVFANLNSNKQVLDLKEGRMVRMND